MINKTQNFKKSTPDFNKSQSRILLVSFWPVLCPV